MSLTRDPLPPSEATRGTALNNPFWPGGFPDPVPEIKNISVELTEGKYFNLTIKGNLGYYYKIDISFEIIGSCNTRAKLNLLIISKSSRL